MRTHEHPSRRRAAVAALVTALVVGGAAAAPPEDDLVRELAAAAAGTGTATPTVRFAFVAPTGVMVAQFGAAAVHGGYVDGYRGVALDDATVATFRRVAPPNLLRTYHAMQAGQDLRARVDRLARVGSGRVDPTYLLVDDRTGLGTHGGIFATATLDGKRVVWPAASVSSSGCTTNDYCGLVRLGEVASTRIQTRPGAWGAWEETILHETLHTQFVGASTKWGSIHITYGADRSHWRSELLGDQPLALEEGLATFFGTTHNGPGRQVIVDFFARDDVRYLLESRSVLAGTRELWNAPHVEEERAIPEHAAQTGRYLIRGYRWHDVPGFYVLFSESTSTAFHTFFWEHATGDRDVALGMIERTARAMWDDQRKRYLAHAVNRLALELEAYAATEAGETARALGELTSSLYPFALLDVVTHFGMTDAQYRQEYERQYPDRHPRAWPEYWNHRADIRRLVEGALGDDPIRIREAVDLVHQYCTRPDTILAAETPPSGGGEQAPQ